MSEKIIGLLDKRLQTIRNSMGERHEQITRHQASIASLEEEISADKAAISDFESAISVLKASAGSA